MFFVREPSNQAISAFIADQRDRRFSYEAVGATANIPSCDYTIDHNRIELGAGEETYQRAVENLKCWRQFDLGWTEIVPSNVPVEVGSVVAVKARAFGTWSLNACRIVYLINDEESPVRRFGFAYGTLPSHVETGEERFTLEWHKEDDSVWYDILAFSRPRHPLVRMSFPLARLLQRRFVRESMKRMVRASQP
jgi:uncharacterized protein (UPF0548 family)